MFGGGGAERLVRDVIEGAVEELEGLGATAIEIEDPDFAELTRDASVIAQEFRFHFDDYLQATPGAYVRSLAEIIDSGLYHRVLEAGLASSLEVETLDTDDYRERLARRDELRGAVAALLDEQDLDALVYPTIRQTAQPIGALQSGSNCTLSALSGMPAITVPAGFADDGMPVGLELLGRSWSEPRLIELAYAYEQATGHRRAPDFTPSLVTPPAPVELAASVQAAEGLSADVRFVLDPATRVVRYRVSAFGLLDDDVLLTALHRRAGEDAAAVGPVLRDLERGGGARAAGEWRLSGAEMLALRDGRLYLAVHTVDHLAGAIRVDLSLPDPPA